MVEHVSETGIHSAEYIEWETILQAASALAVPGPDAPRESGIHRVYEASTH